MSLIDWHRIKERIYYWDGSWRDIYVFGTTHEDWSKWIDLVNQKYPVEFYNGQTGQSEETIQKMVVFDYFAAKTDLVNTATIWVGNISVKCSFLPTKKLKTTLTQEK